MTDRSFVSGSIAELLAAVAAGVRDAQEALSAAPPLDAAGRPVPTYHMPYVDFEFRVDFEARSAGSALVLFARPTSETSSISSVVSGRLVAIPPGEGRPLPLLELTAERQSARKHKLVVTAANTAGELLAGATVELNFDLAASQRLSQAAGVALPGLRASTFEAAVLTTGEDGRAETVLSIDAGLPAAALVMVTAEFGTATANLSLTAGNA